MKNRILLYEYSKFDYYMKVNILDYVDDSIYGSIVSIMHAAHIQAKERYSIETSTDNITVEELREKVEGENGTIFLAIENEKPVGTITFFCRRVNTWYAKGLVGRTCLLATLPEYQGQGIASKLKEATVQYAKSLGAVGMETTIAENNYPSIRLQKKMGYIPHTFRKWPSLNHCSIMMIKYLNKPQRALLYLKIHFLSTKILTKTKMCLGIF